MKAMKVKMIPRMMPVYWKAQGMTVRAVPAIQFQVQKMVIKLPCIPSSSTP